MNPSYTSLCTQVTYFAGYGYPNLILTEDAERIRVRSRSKNAYLTLICESDSHFKDLNPLKVRVLLFFFFLKHSTIMLISPRRYKMRMRKKHPEWKAEQTRIRNLIKKKFKHSTIMICSHRRYKMRVRNNILDVRTEEDEQIRVRSIIGMQEQECVPNRHL